MTFYNKRYDAIEGTMLSCFDYLSNVRIEEKKRVDPALST